MREREKTLRFSLSAKDENIAKWNSEFKKAAKIFVLISMNDNQTVKIWMTTSMMKN